MQIGDLVRVIKTDEVLLYLGIVDGSYRFWHHKWEWCWFNPNTFPPEKYEVIE